MGRGSHAALVTHPHLPGPTGGRPVHLSGAKQEEGRREEGRGERKEERVEGEGGGRRGKEGEGEGGG